MSKIIIKENYVNPQTFCSQLNFEKTSYTVILPGCMCWIKRVWLTLTMGSLTGRYGCMHIHICVVPA